MKRRLHINSLLAVVLLLVLGALFWFWQPRLTNATLSYVTSADDVVNNPFTMPLHDTFKAPRVTVKGNMRVPPWYHGWFWLYPDDCVHDIRINDVRVESFQLPICRKEGALLNLHSYLEPGRNTFEVIVSDEGGVLLLDIEAATEHEPPLLVFTIVFPWLLILVVSALIASLHPTSAATAATWWQRCCRRPKSLAAAIIIFLVLLGLGCITASGRVRDVVLRSHDQTDRSLTVPFNVPSKALRSELQFTLELSRFSPQRYRFFIDDCLRELRVNDQLVAFEGRLCGTADRVVDLSAQLRPGSNQVVATLDDFGGRLGFAMEPVKDSTVIILKVLIGVLLLVVVGRVVWR